MWLCIVLLVLSILAAVCTGNLTACNRLRTGADISDLGRLRTGIGPGSLEYRAWTGAASPARRARYQPGDKSIISPCIFSLHSVDTDRGTGTALPVPVLDPALFQILHLYPTRRMDGALSGTCGRRGSRRAEWKSLTNGGEGNRKAIRGLRGIEDLSSPEAWSWWT